MRPIRLELKNFTAYRDPQVLLFDDLDLFAITGPTGSGKSSLLDAMTFALYGKVPRVGNRSTFLIAQGQPALSVRFDFDVDGRRFRVVRTTGHRAASATIRLEEQRHGEWESYGDGADRIRDATKLIEGLVGLDYEAFTRSVLLPQGQFQEFLVGDPAERRGILTELLGLELFERMARRAGEVAREARSAAQAMQEILDRQYEGVDHAAVKEAGARAKQAKARSHAMAEVHGVLEGLANESKRLERRIEALEELAGEVRDVERAGRAATAELEHVVAELEQTASRAAAVQDAAVTAESAFAEATRDLAAAEERWGSLESLARLRGDLGQLAALDGRIAATEGSLVEARVIIQAKEAALEGARRVAAEAAEAMDQRAQSLAAAEAEHEQAHRADLVGALTRGRRVGDPCPVCERPLEEVPKVDARELDRVKRVLDRAKEAASVAANRWSKSERDASLAERDLQIALVEAERLERDMEGLRAERSGLLPAFEPSFGDQLPEDPVGEVDGRIDDLRTRHARVEDARAAAARARDQATHAREEVRDLTERAAVTVGLLRGLPIAGLMRRMRQSLPHMEAPAGLVGAVPGEPGPALEAARALAGGTADLAEMVDGAARDARSGVEAILAQARSGLPEGMPKSMVTDLDDLLDAARTSAMELAEAAAEARHEADRLAGQLKESRQLEQEVRARNGEAAVHHALAGELRADRLIDFLQGEALELLAEGGSDRLLFLSQGRYRLAFDQDEFYVEDRQNGDERRSVRTLSGGETFLASLALALALSEQIQSLAVSRRARLESLFIDEGFGALDPQSLEIATEALAQLGGQDRMVGVITHVSELAERLPVRIEVRPLPGGSQLEMVS